MRLSEFTIDALAGLVLEVKEVNDGDRACGVRCPWGSGHAYCGRVKGQFARKGEHDDHFTQADVYEHAAPRLAQWLKEHL